MLGAKKGVGSSEVGLGSTELLWVCSCKSWNHPFAQIPLSVYILIMMKDARLSWLGDEVQVDPG